MTAEFDWWLLILGLVIGAGLVWLILAELPRSDPEIGDVELELEATWIAAQLRPTDGRWDPGAVAAVLREHGAYLKLPPPDEAPSPAASPAPAPTVPVAPASAVAPGAPASRRSDASDAEPDSGTGDAASAARG